MRLTLALCLAFWVTPALAQSAEDADRYSIVEYESGIVRVDRKTGAVDHCRTVNDRLACQLAPQERQAWQRETDGLQDRVSDLEKRLARLESGDAPTGETPGLSQKEQDELDKAMDTTERVMRRFMGMMKDLSKEFGSN